MELGQLLVFFSAAESKELIANAGPSAFNGSASNPLADAGCFNEPSAENTLTVVVTGGTNEWTYLSSGETELVYARARAGGKKSRMAIT